MEFVGSLLGQLDFLPDSLSPKLKLIVYGLVGVHVAALSLYLCYVGPGLFSGRRLSQQELLSELIRQSK
jgi:hypothetical protein